MNKIIAFLLFLTLSISYNVQAQGILNSNNLKAINVDNLTDEQILEVRTGLDNKNISIDQAETLAISRGMSKAEFSKLRARIQSLSSSQNIAASSNAGSNNELRTQEVVEKNQNVIVESPIIFGSELFNNPSLSFEPNLKLATPVGYVLGPGDELQISVYGVQEFNAALPVTVEGRLNVQYVGQISVAGMTIEAATQKIKNAFSKVYSTISSGQSQVSVTLSRIRTIKVTIIGSKQPGNYSVSSLTTVYNALHLAGGPASNGSYRNIELLRNNKVIRNIDLYRFLVNGDASDNVGLKDNDVIRIPVYNHRVTVEGQVKRPGIFEMKSGESFEDLIGFASGFSDDAYTASVNIIQKTDREYKVRDLKAEEFSIYQPQPGDLFRISGILNRYENRITINGAVFRPGTYSFYEGMRIADLILQADGLREDAYTQRARIIRLKPDLTTEMVEVNLADAIGGDPVANITLQREDVITIYSLLDFKENYKVTIAGEIKRPGKYNYYENLTLNDLLIEAGGLTGAASKRVEIARMVKSEDIKENDTKRVELIDVEINAGNNEQLSDIELFPFDVINIRKLPVYEEPQGVSVIGEVLYPGNYILTTKEERIHSIITRAGGLTGQANIKGVKIKRPIKSDQIEDIARIDLNLGKNDSIQDNLTDKVIKLRYATIPVNWEKIINNKDHFSNIMLYPGDEIEVSPYNEAVKVSGNVLLTSEIPYRKGKGFNYYLNAVGGVNAKGWKRKSYIIYPNGNAAITENFLFFRSYPKVEPGSQIIVPEKPVVKRLSTGEVVGIASVLTSLAGVIIAILR